MGVEEEDSPAPKRQRTTEQRKKTTTEHGRDCYFLLCLFVKLHISCNIL